jgi:hypothetical protein
MSDPSTDLDTAIVESRARTLAAAKAFSRLMAEFDGDITCCGEAMTELLDAADHLMKLEGNAEKCKEDKVVDLSNKRLRPWEITREFKRRITVREVVDILRRRGSVIHGREYCSFTKEEDDFITRLRISGMSYHEIARQMRAQLGIQRTAGAIVNRLVDLAKLQEDEDETEQHTPIKSALMPTWQVREFVDDARENLPSEFVNWPDYTSLIRRQAWAVVDLDASPVRWCMRADALIVETADGVWHITPSGTTKQAAKAEQ